VKATGICHTDEFTLSGADPEGLFPAILGHEGAGIVVDVGPGVTSVKKGDHVIPLYTPECRQCPSCLSRKTNLCTAIRATQGQGVMPDGTSRFSLDGKKLHHYILEFHGPARDRRRQDSRGRSVRQGLLHRLRGHHRHRRRPQHRQGGARLQVRGVRARRYRPQCHPGAAACRRRHDRRRRCNNSKKQWGERFGMTHFVNPKELGSDLVAHLVNMTKRGADQIGGADYTFDCTGNVTVMRQALEACHRGWGQSIIIGVAPAGAEIATRPFQLVTGRVWKGTAFGGARGRTDVPKIVDWYMDGKIEIDPMITHTMALADINKGFDLMHEGKSIRSVVLY
jgi:S-(hydroxymethyl)glutathione dehydrogenase/alcohol dehydrogenase